MITAKLTIVPEQLHSVVPGGIGVYTLEILRAAMGNLISAAPSIEIYGSNWTGSGDDPFLNFGAPIRYAKGNSRFVTRWWDVAPTLAKINAGTMLSLSMAGPISKGVDRSIFAIYDLAFRQVPEVFTPRGRRWHEKRLAMILDSGAEVITLSHESASDLEESGFASDRIHVILPGSDHLPYPDFERTDQLLAEFEISSPFLLVVGTLEPRKNLQRIFDAIDQARPMLGGEFPVVVVGPDGWGSEGSERRGVNFAGKVGDRVLSALYQRAALLVYAPLFEGFGLPPLEAMAAALPVVASKLPSTDEQVATIVDPMSVDSIADGIVKLLTSESIRSRQVREGLLRSNELTWKEAGQRLSEIVVGSKE